MNYKMKQDFIDLWKDMKFKNTVVKAMQFKRGRFEELKKFTNGRAKDMTIEKKIGGKCTCFIESEGHEKIVLENDYVVLGEKDILHVIDRDMFETIYRIMA